jgi:hypothetical protein
VLTSTTRKLDSRSCVISKEEKLLLRTSSPAKPLVLSNLSARIDVDFETMQTDL